MRKPPAVEVLWTFLKLGLTSFGGPVAHLGYFREEMVIRRGWVTDTRYAEIVALCQFLPGPASSQVGVTLGLIRAGYWGAVAAWVGFTLPSAVLMTMVAFVSVSAGVNAGAIHGLELVGLAVVSQAVWGMARTLCPDPQRAAIALIALSGVLLSHSALAQLAVILFGGVVGAWLCRAPQFAVGRLPATPVSRRAGALAFIGFLGLLVALPPLGGISPGLALFGAFYRSGALVFGGGHVVLPLLSEAFVAPGWVSQDAFLAGYGAAQALPGPLFSFAAYLGAVIDPAYGGIAGATRGLLGIYLPGVLILFASLPFWDELRQRPGAQAAMRGINASVVGILAAALYNPLWMSAVKSHGDVALAAAALALLAVGRVPVFLVVIVGALAGMALSSSS